MSIDKLKKMKDVEVSEAFNYDSDEEATVYRVAGPGYTMMVREDDEELIKNLSDPKLHQERVKALEDG